jgi:anti-anti-sigma factor
VVLDLRGVGYLASAGIGLLLEAAARVRHPAGPLSVRVTPGSLPARVLALTGLTDALAVTSA